MKKIFTIICFAIFLSASSQNTITFKKKDFNIVSVISELFEAKHDDVTKEFIWKPNFAEKLEFGVSSDGYLYTKLDTLLVYGKDKSLGTIVTSTYVKDANGEKEDCHVCSPSLSLITFKLDETRENLELLYFKKFVTKYGSWGEPAQVGFLQISEDDFCINVSSEWQGQGITIGYQNLYYYGNNILNIDSYEDNFGSTSNKNEQISYETKVSVDKVNKIITLTKKGTEISEKTNKKILINKIEKFRFDENYGKFIKICN